MFVVPVYNMILSPDATLYFQKEQLKACAGGKEPVEGEKVILVVTKEQKRAVDLTEESFYPIGLAGVVTDLSHK